MIGTREEEGKGCEACIGDDRDPRGFPNNAASEQSDRVLRCGGGLVQKDRDIEAKRKRENWKYLTLRRKRLKMHFKVFM